MSADEFLSIGHILPVRPDMLSMCFKSGDARTAEGGEHFESCGLHIDRSGAKVAFGNDADGVYVTAGLRNTRRHPSKVFRTYGSITHVDICPDGAAAPMFRVLAYSDYPPNYPLHSVSETPGPVSVAVSLSACALEAQVFEDMGAFNEVVGPAAVDVTLPNGEHIGDVGWGPSLIAMQLTELYSGSADPRDAHPLTQVVAVVSSAQLRTNTATGNDLWYIEADEPLAMALAASPEQLGGEEVRPGNVMAGVFTLAMSDGTFEDQVWADTCGSADG